MDPLILADSRNTLPRHPYLNPTLFPPPTKRLGSREVGVLADVTSLLLLVSLFMFFVSPPLLLS